MKHTKKSLILLFSLISIVIFFTGLNLGKYIEKINESVPIPTPTIAITPTPSIAPMNVTFNTTDVSDCGISVLLPSTLSKRQTPRDEAEFSSETDRFFVTCNESLIQTSEDAFSEFEASQEAEIAGQRTTVFSSDAFDSWIMRNTDKKRVLIESTTSISTLIQQTLELK